MIGKTIFSIFSGVIPIDMHYRFEREGVPKVPTAIVQLEEKTLVAAGMSMMWDTRDPSVAPIYAFRSKGYNLMNVLDPEVGGEMTTRILPEGERPWVDQIRDNFLHHSSKSLATYVATVLGARPPTNTEVSKSPTREEAILLSSEEST
ncbi:hypothetical protein Hanom_Chr15g01388301 [Helianthus anomalus]